MLVELRFFIEKVTGNRHFAEKVLPDLELEQEGVVGTRCTGCNFCRVCSCCLGAIF